MTSNELSGSSADDAERSGAYSKKVISGAAGFALIITIAMEEMVRQRRKHNLAADQELGAEPPSDNL